MTGPNYGLLDNAIVAKNRAMEGYGAANALYSQALENQAAQVGIENAMAERAAGQAAGGDINKYQQNLMTLGQGKQAVAIGKAVAETQKAGAEGQLKRLELERERFSNLRFNPSNENILAHLQDSILRGDSTPENARQIFSKLSQMNDQQRVAYFTNAGLKASELISTQLRERGTVPAGYRMTPEGNLEAIPGGPTTTPLAPKELQKREADYPAASAAIKGYETKADSFIKDLQALRDHPGLENITGVIAGRTPSFTAEGRAAQALYDKIVAKGGFQALQDLRSMSKTGGALGNVSNQEGKQLVQSFAAISQVQDAKDVRAAIDQAISDIEGSKTRTREAYDATYEYRNATPAAGGGAPITGDSDAAKALARFRALKGK